MMTFKTFDSKRLNLPADKRQNLEHAYHIALQFAESPDGWLSLWEITAAARPIWQRQ
jgi:DNA replication protein DnaC